MKMYKNIRCQNIWNTRINYLDFLYLHCSKYFFLTNLHEIMPISLIKQEYIAG